MKVEFFSEYNAAEGRWELTLDYQNGEVHKQSCCFVRPGEFEPGIVLGGFKQIIRALNEELQKTDAPLPVDRPVIALG